MELRGTKFGRVFNASGARNFFPETGYWFHDVFKLIDLVLGLIMRILTLWLWKPRWFDTTGCTFITKTTTINERKGFMPLEDGTIRPRELKPRCIIVKPFAGVVLNKVGLSGPGAAWLFKQSIWQNLEQPFVVSFMSVGKTPAENLAELGAFIALLASQLRSFKSKVALQINFSCPNTEHGQTVLLEEVRAALDLIQTANIGVPVILKFNVELPIETACKIAEHPGCDALEISNTIPWGHLPKKINWRKLFGSDTSPLVGVGGDERGGGLSGAPLLPLVLDWLHRAKAAGLSKPLLVGGGILSARDAVRVIDAGADAIVLGCVFMLRPWCIAEIIRKANETFEQYRPRY